MKKIIVFLMGLAMIFSLTSCVTAVHAQDDTYFDGEVDATIVISYGTPIIVDDMIAYYTYRGWYYYPYWVNNTYYFHRYRRPLPPNHFHDWYRPIPRSYHFPRPDARHHHMRSSTYHSHQVHRHQPAGRHGHNNIGTHTGRPHGNFGGRPSGNMGGRPSGGHHRGGGLGGRR
jgi:hypothetical protein